MGKFLAAILLLAPLLSSASERKQIFLGHNLTATSDTLPENTWTLGNYALGVGLTEELQLSTSPWMLFSYEMLMMNVKYANRFPVIFDQYSFEGMYFDSIEHSSGESMYQQQSTFFRLTGTKEISDYYRIHSSVSLQHFFDRTRTYSLMPDSGNETDANYSIGILNEIKLKHVGLFLEAGIMGLNFYWPYYHLGASLFVYTDQILVQLGASYSHTFDRVVFNDESRQPEFLSAFHPEFQVQVFF